MSYVTADKKNNATDVAPQHLSRFAVIDVLHREGIAKVAENPSGQTVGVRADEAHIVLVANGVQGLLLAVQKVRRNDHLE